MDRNKDQINVYFDLAWVGLNCCFSCGFTSLIQHKCKNSLLCPRVTEEESTATTMEALKARIRELEKQILRGDRYKCLICMVSIFWLAYRHPYSHPLSHIWGWVWGNRSRRKLQASLLPATFFSSFWDISRHFQTTASSLSALGFPPCCFCPENFPREAARSHPNQMLKLPQLTSLSMKEEWF